MTRLSRCDAGTQKPPLELTSGAASHTGEELTLPSASTVGAAALASGSILRRPNAMLHGRVMGRLLETLDLRILLDANAVPTRTAGAATSRSGLARGATRTGRGPRD